LIDSSRRILPAAHLRARSEVGFGSSGMDSTLCQFRRNIAIIPFFSKRLLPCRLIAPARPRQDDATGAPDAGAGRLVATITSSAHRLR
jgi:hypothetical protein